MGTWTRNYSNILTAFFGLQANSTYYPWAGTGYVTTQPTGYSSSIVHLRTRSNRWYITQGLGTNNSTSLSYCAMACFPFVGQYYNSSGNTPETDQDAGRFTVQFGSGSISAETQYDAYALNTPITSGLTMTNQSPSVSSSYDSTGHKFTRTASFGISNTSGSNKTITEVGLFLPFYYGHDGSYAKSVSSLVYYDTFEAITLEPYESIVLTISQSFPIINYEPYPAT